MIIEVHIEGIRNPPKCLFDTLFRVSVPLSEAQTFIQWAYFHNLLVAMYFK
jgi:hypothetical protein